MNECANCHSEADNHILNVQLCSSCLTAVVREAVEIDINRQFKSIFMPKERSTIRKTTKKSK
jgi:hypothetical protein